MLGWIALHRKTMDHWIWDNDKYFKAWVYCLFRANHESNKLLIGSDLLNTERGQFVTSINRFAADTKMTTQSVRTFWKLLEKDSMINKQTTSKLTIITICNYDSYQSDQQTKKRKSTNQQQTSNKPATTDNNNNNENNEKKVYRKFAHLSISIEEVRKINDLGYTKKQIDDILDSIENFKGNTKYKSLYLTAKKWLERERKTEGTTLGGRNPKSEAAPENFGVPSKTAMTYEEYLKNKKS